MRPPSPHPPCSHAELKFGGLIKLEIKTTTTTTIDTDQPATFDGAYRGRRMSWAEFYRLRPDLRPSNDNKEAAKDAA